MGVPLRLVSLAGAYRELGFDSTHLFNICELLIMKRGVAVIVKKRTGSTSGYLIST